MNSKKILNIVLACLVFFVGATSFAQTADIATDEHGMQYIPGQLIVKFKENKVDLEQARGMQVLSQMEDRQDFQTEHMLPVENLALITIDENKTIQEEIARLLQDPNVQSVQPNFVYHILMSAPDDMHFDDQRGLDNAGQVVDGQTGTVGADMDRLAAMDIRSGDGNQSTTGTTVAVLDVGAQYTHPDLSNQMWNGVNCLSATGAARGNCLGGGFNAKLGTKTPAVGEHGPHVAGIIGAEMNNGIGVAGINPNARIMNINLGNGNEIDSYAALSAIHFAKYNGARILNLSRGGSCEGCTENPDPELYIAIRDFPGLVAIAAGNDHTQHIGTYYFTPADFAGNTPLWSGLANVISVAATDNLDHLADFSDYGPQISIAAPGVSIASTVPTNQYAYMDGTSMATPYVAGAISLLRSFRPELSYQEIKRILMCKSDTLASLSGKVIGGKRLNIYNGLLALFLRMNSLNTYPDTKKLTNINSGTYISGSSVYIEWAPSSPASSMNLHHFTMIYSGNILESTGGLLTGATFGLSGDGIYTCNVFTTLSGSSASGETISTTLYVDNTKPTASTYSTRTSGTKTSGDVVIVLTGYSEQLFNINRTGYTFTGDGTFTFTFSDIAGNTGSVVATVTDIDKILPTFTGVVQDGLYTTGVSITFADNNSGVTATLNGSGYTGNTLISANGSYVFVVRDTAGNSTGASFIIDNIPPLPPVIQSCGALWNGSLSWSAASDTGAGMTSGYYIYRIYLSGNSAPVLTGRASSTGYILQGVGTPVTITVNLTGNGDYLMTLASCDAASNCASANTGVFTINKPLAFAFTAQTDKELSQTYTSNEITLTGLITGATIIIQGGSYSINGGTGQTETGIVYNGDKIILSLTSSSANSSTTSSTLNIGGLTGSFSVTTKAAPSGGGGGGGGGGMTPKICALEHLMCSGTSATGGVYIRKNLVTCEGGNLGMSCSITGTVVKTGVNSGIIYHTLSPVFSPELNQAYSYAREIGITTVPSIEKANMTGTLIRVHLAKMISNFAINVLDKKPNTGMHCLFEDMQRETQEMQIYAKLACQLGLMGLANDGTPNTDFHPELEVTRAQFGTVLSRALRGDKYNDVTAENYFTEHLAALNDIGIMKNINDPLNLEIRGYVMLMLMRAAE